MKDPYKFFSGVIILCLFVMLMGVGWRIGIETSMLMPTKVVLAALSVVVWAWITAIFVENLD